MRKLFSVLAGLCALVALSGAAHAKIVRYHSRHPIPAKFGSGFCEIDVPHIHAFGPSEPRLYRIHDDEYYFVGDPTPFGYQGPRYSFYGPHPVVEADVEFGEPVYCYLDGPHYHWYQPPPAVQASFEFRGGAFWYVGDFEPTYYRARPHYMVINEVYRPMTYTRPVVDVTVAPPAFRGTVVGGPPGWRGHAVVEGPAVQAGVHVAVPPPPSVHVGVGVQVGGPPQRVIVAPPHERVIVARPPGPQPVIIERERREHHDNGRHEGWYKHGGRQH